MLQDLTTQTLLLVPKLQLLEHKGTQLVAVFLPMFVLERTFLKHWRKANLRS